MKPSIETTRCWYVFISTAAKKRPKSKASKPQAGHDKKKPCQTAVFFLLIGEQEANNCPVGAV
ncbi:hypothetical protein EJB05_19552, partial [Eragrostis curvula]